MHWHGKHNHEFDRHALAMVNATQPRYVCHAVEINMYRRQCGDTLWAAVVDFANEVHMAIRHASESTVLVFPSFHAEYLRGQENDQAPCHGKNPEQCIAESMVSTWSVWLCSLASSV